MGSKIGSYVRTVAGDRGILGNGLRLWQLPSGVGSHYNVVRIPEGAITVTIKHPMAMRVWNKIQHSDWMVLQALRARRCSLTHCMPLADERPRIMATMTMTGRNSVGARIHPAVIALEGDSMHEILLKAFTASYVLSDPDWRASKWRATQALRAKCDALDEAIMAL